MFDDDQNLSTFWINITETNDNSEHLEITENNLSIMEKKQIGDEVAVFLSNSGKKRKRVNIFPWIPLFFLQLDSK